MKLTIAGEQKQFDDGLTVRQLIEAEEVSDPDYVTVALNDEFLQLDSYDEVVLADGDTVEFLYFMGGGGW